MHSPPTLTVISLGAGVQSSSMALMASQGAFDRTPDCAIFPDTRWEPYAGQLARDDPRNFFYVPELPGENEQ